MEVKKKPKKNQRKSQNCTKASNPLTSVKDFEFSPEEQCKHKFVSFKDPEKAEQYFSYGDKITSSQMVTLELQDASKEKLERMLDFYSKRRLDIS